MLNKGLKWSISNWEAVSVWDDFWLALVPLMDGEGNISVKDFLSNVIGISFVLPDYIMQEIKGILLASNPLQEDLHIWAFSKDGNFSLKSVYLIAEGLNPLSLDTFNMWVWNSKTMSR